MKLNNLEIHNYRSLVDVNLEVRDLAVVIGPNSVGKTALLEVFQLLGAASQLGLAQFLSDHGGFQAVVTHGQRGLLVTLDIDVESPDISEKLMHYTFELGVVGNGYGILEEELEWHRNTNLPHPLRYIFDSGNRLRYFDPSLGGLSDPTWTLITGELGLAQVPRMYQEPEAFRNLLASTQHYGSLDVGPSSTVRIPQSLNPTTRPGPNGESLFSALYNLRAMHDEDYNKVLGLLRQGFPSFDRLEFPVVGAGQVTLAWYERGDRTPFFPNQLSEGTLRFLWLVTVLLAPPMPARILLDEPEVSLHPELLKLLAALLQQAAVRSQIVVATHSPDLIRWLEPEEVLVADKEDGATNFTWADELDLAEWLKEYSLSDLWLMGNLGGRP